MSCLSTSLFLHACVNKYVSYTKESNFQIHLKKIPPNTIMPSFLTIILLCYKSTSFEVCHVYAAHRPLLKGFVGLY